MNKKFMAIWESWMNRYNHSGFLVGDIVTFRGDAIKHPFVASKKETLPATIKDYIESGCTLRVKNIINNYPSGMAAGNTDDAGPDFTIEVAKEWAPGRLDDGGIQVHPGMLDVISVYPNLTPIPDKFKRKEKINIKPTEVDAEDEEVPFYSPKMDTDRVNVGDKITHSPRLNPTKNIGIPSMPSKGNEDPSAYTAMYLPKETKKKR